MPSRSRAGTMPPRPPACDVANSNFRRHVSVKYCVCDFMALRGYRTRPGVPVVGRADGCHCRRPWPCKLRPRYDRPLDERIATDPPTDRRTWAPPGPLWGVAPVRPRLLQAAAPASLLTPTAAVGRQRRPARVRAAPLHLYHGQLGRLLARRPVRLATTPVSGGQPRYPKHPSSTPAAGPARLSSSSATTPRLHTRSASPSAACSCRSFRRRRPADRTRSRRGLRQCGSGPTFLVGPARAALAAARRTWTGCWPG